MNWLARLILRWMPRAVVLSLPEDRTQATIDRGRRADALLRDEGVSEAFDALTENLIAEWRITPPCQTEQREALYHRVHALQSVRDELQRWSEDAVYVAAQIEKRRS